MPAPIVVISGLHKSFKGQSKPALKNIDAAIYPGRITGLVGPDGAGKSTLIRLLAGLLLPDSGSIAVKGFNPSTEAEKIHELAGYMPQKFGLYEDLSVIENLRLYADLRLLTASERNQKFEKLLKFTALTSFQKRLAGKLSGGMKQKLGLACALIGDPELLLLDEPSVGVDPISRRELWQMVQNLLTAGLAVLWSTAYLDEAEKCDDVILLSEGEKIFDGPPGDLLRKVEGRTWAVAGFNDQERRHFLLRLLKEPEVIDGLIQGRRIRVLTKECTSQLNKMGGQWQKVAPIFEDAFIDILGGGPKGDSVLAQTMPEKAAHDLPVVEAIGLTKKFGDFVAVQNNSFTIKRGEIFGLLGPNGAGKSTTFKMMCGLLNPTAGQALVTGLDLKNAPSLARNRLGYMAQKFSLYDHLSVKQNLNFFSGAYGLSGAEQKQQVNMMLDIFDLAKYQKTSAGLLPLGFKQRLALACAVMHQPDVLFLDEPTSGVDPITRREFWLHINSLVTRGVTVLVTTHFMDEAEYCDRIGLIYCGQSIATGTPDALKEMTRTDKNPDPTMEEAFIALIQRNEKNNEGAA